MLRRLLVQNQFVVVLLQFSGRHVQLLVDFGVLVVDLPQDVHLLGQVLKGRTGNDYSSSRNNVEV